ncbi:RbcX chaperonin protein [Halomicronema hongdechloris C2206]|uniref:RuBisCO chaperone RbcX n=1 Tax=Halomicronema hongdechloris C2206 TaxID=1641165 RepID=A0A1Z3HIU6_9CYAN|nr:chaperonin family protein RbcX [Halomicronema hongdechloris]ASC70203.1 RbcX chaperonin protein [Halomicronema hongdechloris C2206]
MDLKRTAKDTAKVLISYLTFQAVKTVLSQLRETDVPRAYWLNAFSTREALQDGEAYIEALLQEHPDLAMRIMTVRQHIFEEIAEFLPEMVNSGIQQANMEHRRRHLEQITQMSSDDLVADADARIDITPDSEPPNGS